MCLLDKVGPATQPVVPGEVTLLSLDTVEGHVTRLVVAPLLVCRRGIAPISLAERLDKLDGDLRQ